MEADTQLHRRLRYHFPFHKSYLEAAGSTGEVGGFVHESAKTRTASLSILI